MEKVIQMWLNYLSAGVRNSSP